MKVRSVLHSVVLGCVLTSSLIPAHASARGDRVMGSADEGSTLRVAYIQKMNKLDQDKKDCRKEIEDVISPELALLDDFGQLGHAGPARAVKDEGQMQADAQKMTQLQAELIRLGKLLNQATNKQEPQFAKNLKLFERRLREYSVTQKTLDAQSNSLVGKAEQAVSNFVPFARAVLKIKKQEACEAIWADLRTWLPRNMEHMVLKNRERVKQQVAVLKGDHQNFALAASKLVLRFKTKSQVAAETLSP